MNPQQLANLHARCFTVPRPWSAAEFSAILETTGIFLCSRTQGFLIGRMAGPEVELLTLAVDPVERRKGIARSLLQEFEKSAAYRGAQSAFLEVAEQNFSAILLYKNAGYAQLGSRKDYYKGLTGQKQAALVFSKKLHPNKQSKLPESSSF